jgi:20S proteasome alpha/beta subunit
VRFVNVASADINLRLKTFIRNLNAEVSLKDAKDFAVRSLAKAVDKIDYNADNIEVVIIKFADGKANIEYLNS